jgi:predicted dehydrogenase
VRTLVGFQARQDPAILKAKQMVESGKLGKILGTTMYGHGAMLGPVLTEYFLHMLPVEAGANMLTIPFGHAIDALCFVLGEVDSLSATISNHRPEHSYVDEQGKEKRKVTKTSPDYVSFTGTLVGGANVDVTYAEGMSRTGRDFYWEINGTDGSIILEGGKEPLVWGHMQMNQPTLKFVGGEPGAKLGVVKVEEAGDFDKYDYSYNVGKAWDAWAGVGEEVHTVATFEDAVIRHSMIDAIYRSAAKGTRERYL